MQLPPAASVRYVFNYTLVDKLEFHCSLVLQHHLSVQVLDRRWFHNKRCLDIGCNEGVITLAVVQRFAPLSMLGVDIDEGLVKAACRYTALLRYRRQSHYCSVARRL